MVIDREANHETGPSHQFHLSCIRRDVHAGQPFAFASA
jgi:hypothetical protein